LSCPSTFLALTSRPTISRFGERFRDGIHVSIQFGQFLVCCFSTHGVPRARSFVKVEEARAPMPYGVGAGGLVVIYRKYTQRTIGLL